MPAALYGLLEAIVQTSRLALAFTVPNASFYLAIGLVAVLFFGFAFVHLTVRLLFF